MKCLVTGATGLIGKALIERLKRGGHEVIAARRDLSGVPDFPGAVDCIFHCAAMTSSRAFVEQPVETVDSIVWLTREVLEYARRNRVSSVVYLSTMEVYGLTDSESVDERAFAPLDPTVVRNSYPEAKRLAENLCVGYAKEYGVGVKIARLTQTFGCGVDLERDNRVFAEFARAAREGRDLVLKSEGLTARCYCSVKDAVEALLTIAERGMPGEAYNVANPATFCTIREMAESVAAKFSGGRSKVVIDLEGAASRGYLPPFRMKLVTAKLEALGWRPTQSLTDMFAEMLGEERVK